MNNTFMSLSVFHAPDYRAFIRASAASVQPSRGIWAKLAVAAGCQPTYLSQAMKEKCHLTPDHALGIARYFKLSEDETDFFLLLLELERAGTPELQKYLRSKIEKVRREREDLSARLKKPTLEHLEKEAQYYSTWFWSAIHIITSIPDYQTPKAIGERLCLPIPFVEDTLQRLEAHGIVKRSGKNWVPATGDVHLPRSSPLVAVHHSNWRQRAIMSSVLNQNGVHFTAVYSLSRTDFQHLKEKILELIEYSRAKIGPSQEEELACFTCDWFAV
jgi:uncharacterized protein (TIGR02147 family)